MRFGALLSTGLTACVCLADPPASGAQGVYVGQAAIDFGILGKHEQRERTLHVCNGTEQPVRMLGTDSDCTCLNSEVELHALPPSGITTWQIRLISCDYTSETRRHVWLRTSCPEAKVIKVAVRYRVVPELFAEPGYVALGLLPVDSADWIEAVVQVRTTSKETFCLLGAWSNDPMVDAIVEQERVTRDSPGCVRVQVYPPLPEGRRQPTVWVATDSAEVPEMRIPLMGESIAGLRCDRREIVFGDVIFGEAQTRAVTLSHSARVRIGEIRKSNEGLEITEIKRSPGQVVIALKTKLRLRLGNFRGYLTVAFNDGRSRKVKLPYRGNVIEGKPATEAGLRHGPRADTEAARIASKSREE